MMGREKGSEIAAMHLAQELIRIPSLTPRDLGCQAILAARLEKLGFVIEHLRFGDVDNLWAKKGTDTPLFVFVGHTDVVPAGPVEAWAHPPFAAFVKDGYLYGRGAADMKSNIAAMIVACEQFIAKYPEHKGSIGFLITSDEEGVALDGVRKVMEAFKIRGEQLTWCIVGEPSSEHTVGDVIKIGRRGSLNGKIIVHGKQGHIAYPQLADNPIHCCFPAFAALCDEKWDEGDDQFQPTSLQFSNIKAGVGAGNVIPGQLEAMFNFRFSPKVSEAELKQRVTAILDSYGLQYEIEWWLSGMPFILKDGKLLAAVTSAIQSITGVEPLLSTSGGTSDARFIAPTGCSVLELGVCNTTIHQVNECVKLTDLEALVKIYENVLINLLT